METKFGIQIANNAKVLDLRFFDAEEFSPKYIEITEFQYNNFVKIRTPWSKFIGGEIVNISDDEAVYLRNLNIFNFRTRLEDLHIKIGLAERMGEDPKDLLTEFDRINYLYNNLIKL